ncbi:hypothetical protein [Rossellomorea aquimaris]|uniref:hypothetical protein n=1 Tax=Rossellomorea aquimaris TaxID=189382 RepID=UPI001CFD7CA2|nr:hypothetical protein [Rossellomorea aquimaris]
MAVAESNIKTKLDELRKRAAKRKNSMPNNRPSENHLKELEENSKLLYNDQIRTWD